MRLTPKPPCLPIIAIIMVGCDPLRALLVPLFATLDTLLSSMNNDIRRHLLVVARGHLPASLGWAKHDLLVAGGMWGGNTARLLECVPEKVARLALKRAPCVALG
jgi:hypothetical protein